MATDTDPTGPKVDGDSYPWARQALGLHGVFGGGIIELSGAKRGAASYRRSILQLMSPLRWGCFQVWWESKSHLDVKMECNNRGFNVSDAVNSPCMPT